MDRYINKPVKLFVYFAVWIILVIIDSKFFVRVLDESKSIVFEVADANVDGACSTGASQAIYCLVNCAGKLNDISKCINPRLSYPGLVLFDRLLLTDLLAYSCELAEPS